ncbi:hypothetical protein DFP72DRAFT_1045520 [Ephemerocybe angulata]|uniref:DUF7918 domain-containing protein n=1 Tax=Ephemerocybe angulata TaxID=980116 RepID=A0A8H6HYJ6_9AGAR|nr:hypothetical protein DFP72DRAFT_1045520 [Tulosesus angulatus]
MPKCSGWDIWLEIEGKKLEEYGSKQEKLEDERAPSVTCWVPCEAGKEFRFGVAPPPKPLKSNHLLCFTVDGHELVDIDHRDFDEGEDYGPNPTLYEGQEDDEGFRPFMFANLTLTSDDDFIDTGMGQLGELLVHIYKYKSIVYKKCKPKKRVRSSAASRSGPLPKLELEGVVHEKTNKGTIKNCVKFGELKPRAGLTANSGARQASSSSVGTSKPEIKKYTSKYTYQKLVGIVNFKYRSIDILRAEGIAPRLPPVTLSPSPKRPLPAPNSDHRAPTLQAASKLSNGISDNEDEDDDELRALQARLAILEELSEVKAQIAAKLSKKRKRDSKGKVDEPRRVKKEVKIEHFLPGEVIDLT